MKKVLNKTKEQLFSELNDLRNKSNSREEMLKAANQQLQASEQQLRAFNQQLLANEQQLKAANQQLLASESALIYEKEFSESLLEAANAIIITLDKDANITLFNKFAEKLTAYKKEDVLEKNWFDLFIPKRKGSVIPEIFKNVLKEIPEVSSNENSILCKDGSEKLINWENTVLKKENGEILGVLSIGTDITERKSAEKARRKNELMLKEAEKIANVGSWHWDLEADIVHWSDELFRITKQNPALPPPTSAVMSKIYTPESWELLSAAVEKAVTEGISYNLELSMIRPDNEIRIVHTVGKAIQDDTGRVVSLFGMVQDITKSKQTEKTLIESESRFKALYNASFGGIAIHDKGLILECNNGLSELTGYKVDELIGMAGLQLIAEESREMVMENILSAYGKPYEAIGICKNGKKYPLRLEARQIPYKGKNVRVVEFRDITESKKKEEKISKLSTAVEQSPSVIAITDKKGNLEYVNPKFTELTGYTFEEAKGQNPRILKSGEQPDEMYVKLWKTISSGKTWRGEFHNKKKNGELFWESASVSPIFDEHGKIINYIKVAEDISRRKRNEQIQNIIHNISNATNKNLNIVEFIKFIRKEIETIIDTKNFYVILYDDQTKIISLLYHHDQEDKLEKFPQGKTLTNYVIRTKKPLLATKAVKDKLVKSGEIELLGNDSKVWLGMPLLIKENVIGAFAMQSYTNEKAFNKTDIQVLKIISNQISISLERKKAEEDLKSALEKAQESDRLKSAFLTNMSHEIRTPMNGILGFTGLLKEPHLTEDEQSSYIEIIEKSGDRMLNTINDIIDISKIEAGQVKVVKTEVSVNKILEEQYEFFNAEAQSKGLELTNKPTLSNKEAVIITDKHKLEGILINLIKNAIKFTKHGNISFGYLLIKGKDNKELEFYVKDTGIGIPSDRIKAIFNRFEQADIEDTRVFEGSGLGLAISKSYVEMLGGNIQVSSIEGSGSTFTFTIPYIQQSTKYSGIKNTEKKEQKISLTDVSIIITEDDETSQLFFKTIFKNKFRNIIYTASGIETVEAIKKHPETNIILMDIKLPGMNGYDTTREIRKFNQDVVIIAQTAFGLSGDEEKALKVGCDDYITKPINKELLFEKIMLHLSKKRHFTLC